MTRMLLPRDYPWSRTRYPHYNIVFNREVYKDVYKPATITLIYPWLSLPFILSNIVKEKAANLVNIASINKPIFLLNICY
jgi:hypothetical protein